MLGAIDFQHPIFAPFNDPRFSDFSHIHFWKHRRWDIPSGVQSRVLAQFDDGSPALAQVAAGKKAICSVLASRLEPGPTANWPCPANFPPLLETRCLTGVGPAPRRVSNFAPATRSPRPFPLAAPSDGANRTASLPRSRRARPSRKRIRPAIYAAIRNGQERLFAVNIPLEESRTAPISPDELARLGVPLGLDP